MMVYILRHSTKAPAIPQSRVHAWDEADANRQGFGGEVFKPHLLTTSIFKQAFAVLVITKWDIVLSHRNIVSRRNPEWKFNATFFARSLHWDLYIFGPCILHVILSVQGTSASMFWF